MLDLRGLRNVQVEMSGVFFAPRFGSTEDASGQKIPSVPPAGAANTAFFAGGGGGVRSECRSAEKSSAQKPDEEPSGRATGAANSRAASREGREEAGMWCPSSKAGWLAEPANGGTGDRNAHGEPTCRAMTADRAAKPRAGRRERGDDDLSVASGWEEPAERGKLEKQSGQGSAPALGRVARGGGFSDPSDHLD